MDLINQKYNNNFNLMKMGVKNRINLPDTIGLYFTSIYPELYFTTFNAFSRILSNFFRESLKLKNILDEVIHRFSSLICFLTGPNDKIISQSISDDITPQIINSLYFNLDNLLRVGEVDDVSGKQDYIDLGAHIFTHIKHKFETFDNLVKYMLLFSKNLKRDEIMDIKDEIILKIQKKSINE